MMMLQKPVTRPATSGVGKAQLPMRPQLTTVRAGSSVATTSAAIGTKELQNANAAVRLASKLCKVRRLPYPFQLHAFFHAGYLGMYQL